MPICFKTNFLWGFCLIYGEKEFVISRSDSFLPIEDLLSLLFEKILLYGVQNPMSLITFSGVIFQYGCLLIASSYFQCYGLSGKFNRSYYVNPYFLFKAEFELFSFNVLFKFGKKGCTCLGDLERGELSILFELGLPSQFLLFGDNCLLRIIYRRFLRGIFTSFSSLNLIQTFVGDSYF